MRLSNKQKGNFYVNKSTIATKQRLSFEDEKVKGFASLAISRICACIHYYWGF